MAPPPIPKPPYAGGCLCGAARYTISAAPLAVNACHCTDCHKLTGATHLLMLLARSAHFAHDRGETQRWRKHAESGRLIDIVRCVSCGVRLWHEPLSAPEYVFVAAGTLDDPSWAVPTSHIWTRSALPAAPIPDDVWTCERSPAHRQLLIDAFDKAHGR